MRQYEVLCLFRADEEQFRSGVEEIRAEIARANAQVVKEDDMGQRTLAYEVKKQTQGHYYLFVVEMEPESVRELERQLRLKAGLLKHMVVRKDE